MNDFDNITGAVAIASMVSKLYGVDIENMRRGQRAVHATVHNARAVTIWLLDQCGISLNDISMVFTKNRSAYFCREIETINNTRQEDEKYRQYLDRLKLSAKQIISQPVLTAQPPIYVAPALNEGLIPQIRDAAMNFIKADNEVELVKRSAHEKAALAGRTQALAVLREVFDYGN